MKKLSCFFLFVLICSANMLSAQNVTMKADSLETVLCKKWEVDYVLMGEVKVGRMPGAAQINYEFKKDKTFFITSDKPGDNVKGTWTYDTKNKLIKLSANGKSNSKIISLKEGELVMLIDMKEATPNASEELKMVFKEKAN